MVVFAINVVYWFFFLANIMASIMIGVANAEGRCDSWVLQLASTDAPALPDCGGTALLPSEVTIFTNAIYFATATLTTVGYGDIVRVPSRDQPSPGQKVPKTRRCVPSAPSA